MRKIITKQAKIRNLLERAIKGDEKYVSVRANLEAYRGEVDRLNRWTNSCSDEVIRSKLDHYLTLVNGLLKEIRELPVVVDIMYINDNRIWAEGLVQSLIAYPLKGKDLKLRFAQVVFGYAKLIDSEVNARNI